MNRYPDMGSTALYAALAETFGVPADHLSVATGSVGLIYQLVQAFCDPGDEVVFAWRSFEAYPIAVTAAAATSVRVPVLADGRHDLDAMAAAITDRTKIVLVCTPNNPTGPAVTQAELDAFLAQVPSHVLVVVDEAYVEFVRMADPVDGLATYRRARERRASPAPSRRPTGWPASGSGTPSRRPPIAAALRAVSLPFGVSTVAQAAAIASLERQDELLERVDALVAERARVVAGLREVGLGRARGAGQLRLVRARRRGPPTSRPPPTRPASSYARSPARAPGSPSARPRPTTGWSRSRPPSR